jgi:hypothetical protein
MMPTRTAFTAMFLQKKLAQMLSSDALSEAMHLMRQRLANDSRYDDLAFTGHRIGLIEKTDDFRQYLQDIHGSLVPI